MRTKRWLMSGLLAAALALALAAGLQHAGLDLFASPSPQASTDKAGEKKTMDYPVKIPDAELKKRLTPLQYEVTQHKATERAFTGEYWDSHESGLYECVVCGTPLFRSDAKFDSVCGWPSFFQPIDKDAVGSQVDKSFMMVREE